MDLHFFLEQICFFFFWYRERERERELEEERKRQRMRERKIACGFGEIEREWWDEREGV